MKTVLLFVVFCVVTTIFADELSKFNDLRRKFAKDNGIPNMWALRYSKRLLDIAESIPCSTEPGADWLYYFTIGGKNGAEFNRHLFQ
ncbi:hypothetical protein CRE_00703 [Caenorhabditis remanei]|uniref:Uncharacterized protein n=1 Tax=Caenorhabditis remanei TaxID=31234 RepID=E3LDW8_CAERE|nr:hypothetical protein CRE_00703 [Caenorhabditis remanei]